MKTIGGDTVEIETTSKSGMSIFVVYGRINGTPCHWTEDGKFRMDDKEDTRDLDGYDGGR